MKRVLTAVVLIPLVLLLVFKAPLWLFTLVVGLVILLCLHEYLGIVERYGITPVRWPVYLVSILLVVATYIFIATQYNPDTSRYGTYLAISLNLHWSILLLLPLIFGIPVLFRREMRMALAASAASAFGFFYIAVSLVLLIWMRWTLGFTLLTIFVLLSVWGGDIAAYYVGRSLGRHKLAPVVSPNKTWEGAIASVIASVAIAFLVFHFSQQISRQFTVTSPEYAPPLRFSRSGSLNMLLVCALGMVTNIAAQFGDLFESALKRGAQVKDSGSLLPGHGGMLDRIDALLFAIPVAWYYAFITGLSGSHF